MSAPLPPYNVGTLVPSMRDLLQAVRTHRKGLALVPLLAAGEAGREALRMAEAGVVALAMKEPGAGMAEASGAAKIPLLCLRLVATKDDYLAARAYGADGVVMDPAADAELAKGARSTRMAAFPLARDAAEVARAVAAGEKALIVQAVDVASTRELAAKTPPGMTVIAWPARADEDALRKLAGAVDAAIVGVDVYGVTGFERLVSELLP